MEQSSPSGMMRLQQLATFGRYGAEVQHTAQPAASREETPAASRPSGFSQLAASLSGFCSWVAQQAGHKVALQAAPIVVPVAAKQQV